MNAPARHPGGFTLIELLVVLAIVTTLLLLVTPRYLGKVDDARDAVLRENLHTLRATLDKFYGDTGRYPDTLDELVSKKYLRALPMDPVTESTATWQTVPAPDGYQGNVYDIRSGAPGADRQGKPYADW